MKTKDVAKIKLFIFLFFLVAASVHVYYCWRAVASQPTILYNSGIWPKYVGCKIVDLRSPMRSLYPGACGLGDMRSRFLHIRGMLVNERGNIYRFRAPAIIKDTLNEVNFHIDVCWL